MSTACAVGEACFYVRQGPGNSPCASSDAEPIPVLRRQGGDALLRDANGQRTLAEQNLRRLLGVARAIGMLRCS
jgi:hypothetical protein